MMNKIKLLIAIFFASWLFSASLLAQSTSWSFGTFGNFGVIDKISNNSIFIDDMKFRISPTAKFSTINNSDASISLLKKKQMVGFTTIIINSRLLIDHFWLIPDNERGLYRPQP